MRILIADDHGIVRQGLVSVIEKQRDMEIVGQAEDGQTAVELARELSPHVVIMDITMPGLNGVEATRQIVSRNPEIKVVILSMHPDGRIVREALQAGASGYVLKSYLLDDLLKAVHAVMQGEAYLSPQITNVVVKDYVGASAPSDEKKPTALTSRQRQILQLLAEGKSTKQIAHILHISPKTSDAARRKIMNKLNISSMPELTKYAVREGLTSLDF